MVYFFFSISNFADNSYVFITSLWKTWNKLANINKRTNEHALKNRTKRIFKANIIKILHWTHTDQIKKEKY